MDRSPAEVFMQVEGAGHSVPGKAFSEALDQCPSLRRTCLAFAYVYGVQASYTALANARGTLEERLARWLLMAQDRLGISQLLLTHDFLALMLGVRRAGVTTGLQHFESQRLIDTARGVVTILDRDGLVEYANGLYGPPEVEYERVFTRAISD
jgi:CRP-like cAMP-binding protein